MNYLCYLFLSHLPLVLEEKRFIDGKEQTCLVIPAESNQIKKGKRGNWLMILRLAELPPNYKSQTHCVQLVYLTPEYIQRYKSNGIHELTERMGRVYEHDRTPAKKLDRRNGATDIVCDGTISLSDIPKEKIFLSPDNRRRYVSDLIFRSLNQDSTIYTGCICIDDIPPELIKTEYTTGKRIINVRFKQLAIIDTYMNTHQLVVKTDHGTEIEIGRFREWSRVPDPQNPDPKPIQPPVRNNPQTPFSIDGVKY